MKDFEIFEDKNFSSLLKDIYENSLSRSNTVETLINDLRDMVEDPGDAVMIVPIIVQYLDIGVKNDKHLIDLANVVEKYTKQVSKVKSESNQGTLTEDEAAYLLKKHNEDLLEDVKELAPGEADIDYYNEEE
jgi:hypothetical protein